MPLVSLDTLRFRGKIDYTDAQLAVLLDDAEATVIDYLKRPDHGWTEETVPGEVRAAVVRVAVLMLDQTTSDKPVQFIDEGVVALLERHRDPALR